MAQTLNPYASAFRPSQMDEHELDMEYLLPDSLLVSPGRSYEPRSYSRCSPRGGFSSFHLSDIPYKGDYDSLDYAKIPSVWEEYKHTMLKERYLEYELDCERQYQKFAKSNPVFRKQPVPYRTLERNTNVKSHVVSGEQMKMQKMNLHRTHHHQPVQQRMSLKPRAQKYSTIAKKRTNPQQNFSQKPNLAAPVHPVTNTDSGAPKYDAECLLHLVRSQLEFYFSDQNLYEEMHSNLQYYMKLDPQRWVPAHVLLNLPSVAKLTSDKQVVLEALRSSTLLELNEDETKCRRPNYIPPADYKVRKNLRRSVLVYGLPEQMTDESVRKLLDTHGNILCVAFAGMEEGPDPEIATVIMNKKFGDGADLTNLKTAFVVFESQSQANKCVKTRSRHSVDGIRTMHKYDYNKVVKRLGKGQSPLFTPNVSPMLPTNNNSTQMSKSFGGMTNVAMTGNFQLSPSVTKQHKQMPLFNRNNNNLNHPMNRNGFRKTQWRSGSSKGPDSLNWRVDNPMRPRSNSAQNTYRSAAQGKFFERRFSKENQNSFSILKSI